MRIYFITEFIDWFHLHMNRKVRVKYISYTNTMISINNCLLYPFIFSFWCVINTSFAI